MIAADSAAPLAITSNSNHAFERFKTTYTHRTIIDIVIRTLQNVYVCAGSECHIMLFVLASF